MTPKKKQTELHRLKLQSELNETINTKMQFIQRLWRDHFKHNNKYIYFFKYEKSIIQVIEDLAGKTMITPQDINNTFRTFYCKLYTSDPSSADISSFLNKINLPQLYKKHAEALDKPLTQTEFHNALTQMANNKALEPDGFPA